MTQPLRAATRRAPAFLATVTLLQERCIPVGVRVIEEFTPEVDPILTGESSAISRAVVISFGDSVSDPAFEDIAEARGQLEFGEFTVTVIAANARDLWSMMDLVHDALDGKEPLAGTHIQPLGGNLRTTVESFSQARRLVRTLTFELTIQ